MDQVILAIETATQVCSVALSVNGNTVNEISLNEKNIHASHLSPLIDTLLSESGSEYSDLSAIAVSKGPGSYTGLRIGVSTAKGLCFALNIPLISVNTLQAMAMGLASKYRDADEPLLFCPMIDARRMEVYCSVYNKNNITIQETRAMIIEGDSFSNFLSNSKMVFGGDGSEKCVQVLNNNPNAVFLNDIQPSARYLLSIANKKYQDKNFEDTAYFEHFYLKDFIAAKPKVKGLN